MSLIPDHTDIKQIPKVSKGESRGRTLPLVCIASVDEYSIIIQFEIRKHDRFRYFIF